MSLQKTAASALGAVLVGTAAAASLTAGAFAAVSPGQVLISDTQGVIWSYDINEGELEKFADVSGGNFDITYTGPNELLIANTGDLETGDPSGALYTLDLTTFEESLLLADAQVECPISAALTPRGGGVTYVADLCTQSLFALPSGSTTPEFLADVGDNVEVDKRGRVYVAGGDTFLGVDPTTDPVEVETIRTVDGAWLNGFAVTPTGIAYIADSSALQPAVYKVDVTTGELLATYTTPEFRNPEDVAIAPNGDVYVIDSAFTQPPSTYLPGLYLIPSGGTTVETLYQRGDPGGPDEGDLGDPVDILLTPFQGF